jgi:hypothetical protein
VSYSEAFDDMMFHGVQRTTEAGKSLISLLLLEGVEPAAIAGSLLSIAMEMGFREMGVEFQNVVNITIQKCNPARPLN